MWLVPLVITADLAIGAPAGAQAKVCHGQHPWQPSPPQEDIELRAYAELRKRFGFRHDTPYIKHLIRLGLWYSGELGLPVTKAEDRYLQLRERLDLGDAARRYLRRHADVDGGVSIADDWPREPYLLLHLTSGVPSHLAALKRLATFPDNLRATPVRHSVRDQRRAARRIDADRSALQKAGFDVTDVESEFVGDWIDVVVITRRTDYRAYFAERYGSIVKVHFAGTEPTLLECARVETYAVSADGLTLTAHWGESGSVTPERIELAEFADRVEIGAVQRGPNGGRTLDLTRKQLPVRLSAPLGSRSVIDAGSGRRVRQQGQSPREPACPADPEPSAFERLTRERDQDGLPSDPDTVRERLAHGGTPTAAEERWLERQAALRPNRAVKRYLRAHREEFAGEFLPGRFPQEPRIVYRFTGSAARHAAAIQRLVEHPEAVRTETVTYTLRQLDALADQIRRDADLQGGFFDGYGRAGFFFAGTEVPISEGVVRVQVVTTRTDAARYFAARYGPLVRAEVVGDRYECTESLFFSPRTA